MYRYHVLWVSIADDRAFSVQPDETEIHQERFVNTSIALNNLARDGWEVVAQTLLYAKSPSPAAGAGEPGILFTLRRESTKEEHDKDRRPGLPHV